MHVCLATPTGGWVRAPHYRRKAILQASCPTHRFTLAEVDLLIVSKARNELISNLPADCDVVWFVDSDILLPDNASILLDYIEQYPVVSGLYYSRSVPYLPQVYNRATPGLANFAYLPLINLPTEPFQADAVGAGCLLVRVETLKELEAAHIAWQEEARAWVTDADVPLSVQRAIELGASLYPYFEFLEAVGEDFYFCMQLQHFLGIRPYVVPEVECPHETISQIGGDQFRASLGAGQIRYEAVVKASGILPA